MLRAFSFAAALALLAAGPSSGGAQAPAPATTTVILVRHAEKASTPAADPPLTSAGEARARALLAAVREAGVSAIITTQFARTKSTAAPTAVALDITPEVVPATSGTHVQDVAAAIRRHAGQTVLVVGHSNTVPAIIAALGAPEPPPICDEAYDNLYIVTIPPRGPPGLIEAKYGERSIAAGCATMK
jgi:broad specificity phosphatase PhoE